MEQIPATLTLSWIRPYGYGSTERLKRDFQTMLYRVPKEGERIKAYLSERERGEPQTFLVTQVVEVFAIPTETKDNMFKVHSDRLVSERIEITAVEIIEK